MSVAQQQQQAIEIGSDLDRAVLDDAEAWHAYGRAVRRGAPPEVTRSFFDRAMECARRAADLMGERQWPIRSAEWRR